MPPGNPGWESGPNLVGALWRYRWTILVIAFLSASAGYVYAHAQPPVFEAVTRIALASPYDQTLFRQERGVAWVDIDRYLNTQAELVKSPDVLARASQLLDGDLRPGHIRQQVDAETSTEILEVTVRGRSADRTQAADVVNAVAQAYRDVAEARVQADVKASVAELKRLEVDLRRRLLELPEADTDPRVQAERNSLSEELASLQTRAGQIRADAAVYGAGIDRIDEAFPPEVPASDSPRRRAAIFGLLGFIAALIGAFWRSERVQVVDNGDDAAGAVDAPLLGVLPTHPADTAAAAPVVTAPGSSAARDHQFISSSLTLVARDSESRVLLVTSPEAGDAKSVTALNLALSEAQDQRTVILVDVDTSGSLTTLLGAKDQRGVSDLVGQSAGDGDFVLGDCVAAVESLPSVDGFRFVPAGNGRAYDRGIAALPQMAKLLAQLQQEADLVVVDGPPLLQSPGAMKLAAAVDAVILVVRRGTTLDDLRQARDRLDMAKAPIVGYVFDPTRQPSRWRSWDSWRAWHKSWSAEARHRGIL
jgi:succinoglycan biosynthesis transport protein ExoP